MHLAEYHSVLAFVFVLFLKLLCHKILLLFSLLPHFSVCPPLKHPDSPRPYAAMRSLWT